MIIQPHDNVMENIDEQVAKHIANALRATFGDASMDVAQSQLAAAEKCRTTWSKVVDLLKV